MRSIILIAIIFFLRSICIAQVKITGFVNTLDGNPVYNAIVIVKIPTESGDRIVNNTTTDKSGAYEITVSAVCNMLVIYVSNPNIKPIRKEIDNKSQTVDFITEYNSIELHEVIVQSTAVMPREIHSATTFIILGRIPTGNFVRHSNDYRE